MSCRILSDSEPGRESRFDSPGQGRLKLEMFFAALKALPENPEVLDLEAVVRNADIGLSDVSEYLKFDSRHYCRSKIIRFDHVEVLVLGWLSGQKTPIHNHAGSACVVKVLNGQASEISYRRAGCGMLYPQSTEHYPEGTVISSFDEDVHQVANMESAGETLVTLHCYAPPLDEMRVFAQEETIFTGYPELYRQVMERITSAPSRN